jgi:hypothetical protein
MSHLSKTAAAQVRKSLEITEESKIRAAAYVRVERLARAEAGVAEGRIKNMTPLPKLPKDKEMAGRLSSMRARYGSILKSSKSIASQCEKKVRLLSKVALESTKKAQQLRTSSKDPAKKKTKKEKKKTKKKV